MLLLLGIKKATNIWLHSDRESEKIERPQYSSLLELVIHPLEDFKSKKGVN